MATAAQIKANRENARRSTGPKSGTDRTRFNGLKHGLRAEQVVLPGEDPAAFEAERRAWIDDWKPRSHTRAVLVERAAVASWKLRRATRAEAARLYETAADVAHEFDLSQKERIDGALHLLTARARDGPGAAPVRRRRARPPHRPLGRVGPGRRAVRLDVAGGPPRPPALPARPPRRLGPPGLEIARTSLALLAAADPAATAEAAAELRAFCDEQVAELRRERSGFWDPPVVRCRAIDLAAAPTSKEAQLTAPLRDGARAVAPRGDPPTPRPGELRRRPPRRARAPGAAGGPGSRGAGRAG